jgi:hypothetical protein
LPAKRCVDRGCPITWRARRSDTSHVVCASLTASLRRAGLTIFPTLHAPSSVAFSLQDLLVQGRVGHQLLQPAGITYRGDDKSTLGIHSLRVTYMTERQKAGLPPRTVMQLARHTDFRLTAGTYTDMRLIDTFGAVGCLPSYGPEPARQVALRMGTDDASVDTDSQDQLQDQKSRTNPQRDALSCSETDSSDNRCQRRGTRRTSTFHGKNRHSPHTDDARENASELGKKTGLLGLEPRTF